MGNASFVIHSVGRCGEEKNVRNERQTNCAVSLLTKTRIAYELK